LIAPDLGVDLGSTSVVIYVTGRGIVLREAALVILRAPGGNAKKTGEKGEVVAIGEEARAMLGRLPDDLTPVRPIVKGVIADFHLTVLMLRYFLKRAVGVNYLGKPRAVVSVPGDLTEMERRAVDEAFRMAGFRATRLVESVVAAAHGSGLPVYEPVGSLVVDIGGGDAEAAVLSMGAIVTAKSARSAGMAWDDAIVEYVKRSKNLLIGGQTAEEIKMDLGSAVPVEEPQRAMVRGRDVVTGLPQVAEINAQEVYEALKGSVADVIRLLAWVLERTPPELGADVMRQGVYLTGGGGLLQGMDQLLATELGVKVQLARSPMDCVALGTGYLATNLELLSRIGKNHPLTE